MMRYKYQRSGGTPARYVVVSSLASFLVWAMASAAEQIDAVSREVSVMASTDATSTATDAWSREVSVMASSGELAEGTDTWSREVSVLAAADFSDEVTDAVCREISVFSMLSCAGDANVDGIVDPLDSGFVLSRFGCSVGTGDPDCDAADQNGDGIVDPLDVGYVLSRFGECE